MAFGGPGAGPGLSSQLMFSKNHPADFGSYRDRDNSPEASGPAKYELDAKLLQSLFEMTEAIRKVPTTSPRDSVLREISDHVATQLRLICSVNGHDDSGHQLERSARDDLEKKIRVAEVKKRLEMVEEKLRAVRAPENKNNVEYGETALKEIEQIAGKKRKAGEIEVGEAK